MSTITATVSTVSAIPALRHRDTVLVFPADQDDFVAKYEANSDHLSGTTVSELNTIAGQINNVSSQMNVVADEVNTNAGIASAAAVSAAADAATAANFAGAFVGTSTTSVTIGTGSKSFTTQTNEQYTAGIFMTISSQANVSNKMFGEVTAYNQTTGALTVNVTQTWGSGTFADWNVSLSGPVGAAGATFTGGSLTSALNEARATVASHATTADIWGAAGNQIDFTGTATVTAFPNAPQAGATRELICAGACSFTAGANMIIDGVPSGTVTCAAGDTVIVRAISTTQFKLTRLKADGTPQVSASGGAMTYLSTITASGASTVDIETTFDATYDMYEIIISDATVSTDNVSIQVRLKISGAYVTSADYLYHLRRDWTDSTTNPPTALSGVTSISIAETVGNASTKSLNARLSVPVPYNTNRHKQIFWDGAYITNTGHYASSKGWGFLTNIGAVTGVRIFASSGTISGTFRLYGIKTS